MSITIIYNKYTKKDVVSKFSQTDMETINKNIFNKRIESDIINELTNVLYR